MVVESVRKKTNELAFKIMYFSKGDLSKNERFQTANGKTASSHQVMSPTLNLDSFHLKARHIVTKTMIKSQI